MTRKRNFWLKDRCINFYNDYQGEKVYFTTFYSRVRLNPEWNMEELIKPKTRSWGRKNPGIFTGAYAEEMKRWYEQPEPKASKQVFYGRVKIWYPQWQAILTWEKWQEVVSEKPIKKKTWYKCYTWTKQDAEREEEAYTWIDITYSKEEARVFRKEYQRIIDDLEWQLTMIDEKTLVKETNEKLELVKAELALFNSYNP